MSQDLSDIQYLFYSVYVYRVLSYNLIKVLWLLVIDPDVEHREGRK